MPLNLSTVRIILYSVLGVISFIMLALTAARLNYTTQILAGETLDNDTGYYDPIVAELLVTSLFTLGWSLFAICAIRGRFEFRFICTFLGELASLAFLFLLWLSGASVSSSFWGNLPWCTQENPCRLLMALVAFAWLGWLVVFVLFFLNLMFSIANKAWNEPLHGRWDPRVSFYQA